MSKKKRNIVIYIILTVSFVVCCFFIYKNFIKNDFCIWLATQIDSNNNKIKPETELHLSMLSLIISTVVAIATCTYMVVTWKLLENARKEHADNLKLTTRIHSDSLTPYLWIEAIECNLIIVSKNNDYICVNSIQESNENKKIKINSLPDNYTEDEFVLRGTIELKINNASTNIAESSISINGLSNNIDKIIRAGNTESFIFTVERQLLDKKDIQLLLDNKKSITIFASAKGPKGSANDEFEVDFFINIKNTKKEQAIVNKENLQYKRIRNYV